MTRSTTTQMMALALARINDAPRGNDTRRPDNVFRTRGDTSPVVWAATSTINGRRDRTLRWPRPAVRAARAGSRWRYLGG